MKIAVVGIGYVGSSLATLLSQEHEVVAYDITKDRVDSINNRISPIKDKVAVSFYITKYITKSLGNDVSRLGAHLYYASHGLNKATKHGDIYGFCQYLDHFLVNHYDFCDTGMTKVIDGLDWTFAFERIDDNLPLLPLEDFSVDHVPDDISSDVDSFYEAVQEVLNGF